MGANLVTDYKLRVSLDKMTYSPGEIVNGTFSFDFGKDQFKKNNLKIKNPAIAVTIIQTETVQATTQPKSRATTLLSEPSSSRIFDLAFSAIYSITSLPT